MTSQNTAKRQHGEDAGRDARALHAAAARSRRPAGSIRARYWLGPPSADGQAAQQQQQRDA